MVATPCWFASGHIPASAKIAVKLTLQVDHSSGGRSVFSSVFACFTSIAAALLSTTAFADVQVCNKSSASEIAVAFGYYEQAKGWTSIGWSVIPKGSCRSVWVGVYRDSTYYLYAKGGGIEWDAGDDRQGKYFCIDLNKQFTLYTNEHIRAVDKGLDCEAHGNTAKKFRQFDTETVNIDEDTLQDRSPASRDSGPANPSSGPGTQHNWTSPSSGPRAPSNSRAK